MFTGLVEACVPIRSVAPAGTGLRLAVPWPSDVLGGGAFEARAGDSIAVSGCCLTVASIEGGGSAGEPRALAFDLTAETLFRTWFGAARPGRLVHLERALALGDRLGGHFVSGHVDALGAVEAVRDSGDGGRVVRFRGPSEGTAGAGFERWLVEKGSVTVDGVSLTVVAPRGASFEVALVPHTLARTHFGSLRPGDAVHLEGDTIGKWVDHLLRIRAEG